ncbi:ankyrin repeat domain-containing protein [Legionella spiritensis]|uniref:ankyrin repeat domain-containing protein n=1 Tax=Legionella spiritensis TaxID=452 RepID=UPI000F6BADBD|nr:ankyrin repeat domain-containing protein [Legionella spiritensis]VEG91730.1 Uncharacterised protein [Legionella spiritensis]
MHDIIVGFDEKKMGYGDILFAAKLAGELKRALLSEGRLAGDIYLVCNDDNRGLSKLEMSRADCEFGINFVLFQDMQKLLDKGIIKPAVIIDGPAPMLNKLIYPDAMAVVSLEYTYGPFQAAQLGNSYALADKAAQNHYREELINFERRMLQPYPNDNKIILRTGILEAMDERGVIPTKELTTIGTLLHQTQITGEPSAKLTCLKQESANRLSRKIKTIIFGKHNELPLENYEKYHNLTFGYGYAGSIDFIDIHLACSQKTMKNEDIFLVHAGQNLLPQLQKRIEAIKGWGFDKIVYHDVDNNEEHILYDNGAKGPVYRLLHATHLDHAQMIGLFVVSGPLSLVTGDQSFMEAIQANKIICYDCFPHKELLYSAYQDRGEHYSEKTREALKLLRLRSELQKTLPTRILNRLANLLQDDTVRRELSELNEGIREKTSLVSHYLAMVKSFIPPISDPVTKAVIDDAFNDGMLTETVIPEHLFLAIRYGRENIVRCLLEHHPQCLFENDALGNNSFIVAARNGQYDLLALFIQYAADQKIPFATINQANHHFARYRFLDYLPDCLLEDEEKMAGLLGSYAGEARKYLVRGREDLSVNPVGFFPQSGFYKPEKEKNKWLLLQQYINEAYGAPDLEEYQKARIPFLIVAREYLRNQPELIHVFEEINQACDRAGYRDNWIYTHRDEYLGMLQQVHDFIESSEKRKETLGTGWLPTPPPSFWQEIEPKLLEQYDSDLNEEQIKKRFYPFFVVLSLFFQHRDRQGFELLQQLGEELEIPPDISDMSPERYSECLATVRLFIGREPELRKYYDDEWFSQTLVSYNIRL